MNKKYIDEFYSRVAKDKKHEIFALSLPMFLANKHIYNESESFYKTSYDLLHSDIDVLAALILAMKIIHFHQQNFMMQQYFQVAV